MCLQVGDRYTDLSVGQEVVPQIQEVVYGAWYTNEYNQKPRKMSPRVPMHIFVPTAYTNKFTLYSASSAKDLVVYHFLIIVAHMYG